MRILLRSADGARQLINRNFHTSRARERALRKNHYTLVSRGDSNRHYSGELANLFVKYLLA